MKKTLTILPILAATTIPGMAAPEEYASYGKTHNLVDISPLVLKIALNTPEADFIKNKDIFVQNCLRQNRISMHSIALGCLDTVGATSNENITNCENLLVKVREIQNDIYTTINSGMIRYAIEGIKPDLSTKYAATYDGQYYLAKMELPDYIDTSMLTPDVAERYKQQEVVFDTNNQFMCANVWNGGCKAHPDSDTIFYMKEQDDIRISRLHTISTAEAQQSWDPYRLDNIKIGYDGIELFDTYNRYGYEMSRFFDEVRARAEVPQSRQQEALRKCIEENSIWNAEWDGSHTTECSNEKCTMIVQYAGIKYTCEFGPNWEPMEEYRHSLENRAIRYCRGKHGVTEECDDPITWCDADRCVVSLLPCGAESSAYCIFGPNWEIESMQPIKLSAPEWKVEFKVQPSKTEAVASKTAEMPTVNVSEGNKTQKQDTKPATTAQHNTYDNYAATTSEIDDIVIVGQGQTQRGHQNAKAKNPR